MHPSPALLLHLESHSRAAPPARLGSARVYERDKLSNIVLQISRDVSQLAQGHSHKYVSYTV